ncbi:DedA family protein [Marinisporobacter balticus]|uniref:Membrane protein DedA with SNARE-associated domain n=1 Tax=Marinisporobacter balticus TaxID=2018667 RepID=A0A4R2KQ12_9FIRM|nr:DedA family protein [Marinisporobacter balticus]TCO74757.1 membrane protein DedA with SNARE-associated domain [Marinisporobacter balticus]
MVQDKILQLIEIYGYIGMFFALVFGIVGLPIPDEILLVFAGFLVSQGKLDYFLLIIVSFIGSVIGISTSFFIGYCLGWPFLEKYGKYFHIKQKSFSKVEKWYKRYGKYAIIIGYFIPGVRQLNAYYAGITKKSYKQFSIYAYFGGFIWVTTFITMGIVVGKRWCVWSRNFHKFTLFMFLSLCIGLSIYYVVRKIKKRFI